MTSEVTTKGSGRISINGVITENGGDVDCENRSDSDRGAGLAAG